MSETEQSKHCIVVGGGWAGLSCAVELGRLGHRVTVLESARQLGGRARRVAFDEHAVDNGQHVLIGAYHQTLGLFKQLGIDQTQQLYRERLNLHVLHQNGKEYNLRAPGLLAPLNLLFGLLSAKGFSLADRWRALKFGARIFVNAVFVDEDLPVRELLKQHGQSQPLIDALWEPLCLASLNTPLDEASSSIFVRVLHDTFCRSHNDADLIVPATDLGALLPDMALDFIEQHHGNVHISKRVTELNLENNRIVSVRCDKETFTADHVVLAVPPHACLPLIKTHPALHDLAYNLNGFSYHPIVTAYLKYPDSVRLDRPVQGLLGGIAQWVIDRRLCGHPGLMAVVISGPGSHMQMENDALLGALESELSHLFPHWPRPEKTLLIREKRATFNSCVGINQLRPSNRTRIKGLWLAGDYTSTGYPGTLESAIISGLKAAELIHQA